LLVISMFLTACGPGATTVPEEPTSPAEEAQPTEAQASQEPVYLGALLPLSEPGAPQAGQLILRGIELGAEYVNTVMGGSVDGRPVEIVVEDDKGTPEVGASGYRRLVQEKGVIGVTGGYHSSVVLATIEVAKELVGHLTCLSPFLDNGASRSPHRAAGVGT
jgi:branched-chain amino acid transport system substrate-binding protein